MPRTKKTTAVVPARPKQEAFSVEGLIGLLTVAERSADDLYAIYKDKRADADKLREQILARMNANNLMTVKDQAGYSVTRAVKPTYRIADQEAVIGKLEEWNLAPKFTVIVPEHREVKVKELTDWLKDQKLTPDQVPGLELKETEYLSFHQPKV